MLLNEWHLIVPARHLAARAPCCTCTAVLGEKGKAVLNYRLLSLVYLSIRLKLATLLIQLCSYRYQSIGSEATIAFVVRLILCLIKSHLKYIYIYIYQQCLNSFDIRNAHLQKLLQSLLSNSNWETGRNLVLYDISSLRVA